MLFKDATLCDYRGSKKADLRIKEGLITEIGTLTAESDEEVFSCQNKLLMPAIIDLNVMPKSALLSRKMLLSLAQKALKGGVGSVLLSPFTTPSCDESRSIELIKNIDKETAIHLIPSINPLDEHNKLSNISILSAGGAQAISSYSDIDANLLMRIAQYAQMIQIPLMCFCQDRTLSDGVINEGILATTLGLPSIPPYSQTKEVAKICEMLRDMPLQIVFNALAYPRSLEILSTIKTTNPKAHFYSQVSIHHLILDESLCDNYNTTAKINPPLVSKQDQKKLLKALELGEIDLLTSLQCADFNSNKDQVFELASFGIDAISDYFSLFFTHLYLPQHLSLENFSKLASHTPAQILNLNQGSLEVGKNAELMLIDTQASYQITDSFSPYYQQTLQSVVTHLFTQNQLYNTQS
ncbi:metal-dependent hydrolase [Helicobacter sp. MIT 05-5293]|uniref:metal-dependent hydrolase n=1 Tax=Helicobacter sp. MIT 05-5293 TaxID=1548149 RepID=UPI0010FEED05|nr:metal-dependent hydrolase [Helicobacter sp. MIT 05-5293]TLD82222.1 metal-dependent hydrolase [Helicobacter sp. MIT 05-5293]